MIRIYADGAYSSSRDQQGFSFAVFKEEEQIHLHYDGLVGGTNNRAEMNACLNALQYLKDNDIAEPVTIYTDSMYLIGTFTKNYKMGKNTDMWPKLWALITPNISFQHVKGHAGDVGNTLVDKWAVFGSQIDGCKEDLNFKK